MKKFTAVLAVIALTLVASVAMAEVNVSGSVDIRSLMLNNTVDFSDKTGDKANTTQERIRFNVDAKHDNVKGRITFENDWEVWGTQQNAAAGGTTAAVQSSGTSSFGNATGSGVETRPGGPAGGKFGFREAWIDFTIPGATPAHIKVGHQFLQLGNGWFFRSGKYGSDAWLVGLPGKNTIAFVDVKVKEGLTTQSDDVDAYVLLDNYKIDDTKTVGVYWTRVNDRRNYIGTAFGLGAPQTDHTLDTIGLWFNGTLGPVKLQAEIDFQKGKAKGDATTPDDKLKGNQIIVQASVPMDKFTVNAALAQGSGQKTPATAGGAVADQKAVITLLDADPHYTVVYEYFAKTACAPSGSFTPTFSGLKNTGFCNTTAFNLGGSMAVTKWLTASLDFWMLKATEKVWNVQGVQTDKIGNEVDLVLKFKLGDQLTWNWQIARLMADKLYDTGSAAAPIQADDIDAIQGVLSYKF